MHSISPHPPDRSHPQRWADPGVGCDHAPDCPTARLLASPAPQWGVVFAVLFRFPRAVLLALFPEQSILEVFDLRILEKVILPRLFELGFHPGMLCFPIACPTGEIDVLLFGDRDPLLREGGRLPCIGAGERSMRLSGRVEFRRAFHGPVLYSACPPVSRTIFGRDRRSLRIVREKVPGFATDRPRSHHAALPGADVPGARSAGRCATPRSGIASAV